MPGEAAAKTNAKLSIFHEEEDRPKKSSKKEKKEKKEKKAAKEVVDEDNEEAESEGEAGEKLRINEKFAEQFERRERMKDLSRNKDKLAQGLLESDEDDSEEESEDEDAELLDPALDLQIVQTINLLRKKDPRIYDKTTRWFAEQEKEEDDEDDEENEESAAKEKSEKKRFKDVLREQLLRGEAGDSDEERKSERKGRFAYDDEQEALRRAFLSAAGDEAAQNEAESDENEDFLRQKTKTAAEKEVEEKELQKALEEMAKLQPEKDEGEAFLQEFMKKKMWKDTGALKRTKVESESEVESDDEELDKAELFESKYNFRFEELADKEAADSAYTVQGHARNVAGSLRREDDKRKKEREARKERKEKEKRQKEEELKRLKNLKKKELEERLAKIAAYSGAQTLGALSQSLDEDWDPSAHDALMAQQYDDDYYAQEDEEFKPDKDAYADEDGVIGGEFDQMDEEYAGEYAEDADGGEYDESNAGPYDAEAARKAFQSAQDELYALDYEDLVAGIPCRFKYRQVEPEDFGLSAEEILLAEDQELNQYVSLKHLAPYREKKWTKTARDLEKKRKRLRANLKERLSAAEEEAQRKRELKAQRQAQAQSESAAAETEGDGDKKRKRRRRQKNTEGEGEGENAEAESTERAHTTEDAAPVAQSAPVETEQASAEPEKKKDKKKDKRKPFRDQGKKKDKKSQPQDAAQKRLALYS